MKNLIRVFALSLVATGAFAATQINNASAQTTVNAPKLGAMPIPMCPPDGSTNCGMGCGMHSCNQ